MMPRRLTDSGNVTENCQQDVDPKVGILEREQFPLGSYPWIVIRKKQRLTQPRSRKTPKGGKTTAWIG
jgi:hypothetical protein